MRTRLGEKFRSRPGETEGGELLAIEGLRDRCYTVPMHLGDVLSRCGSKELVYQAVSLGFSYGIVQAGVCLHPDLAVLFDARKGGVICQLSENAGSSRFQGSLTRFLRCAQKHVSKGQRNHTHTSGERELPQRNLVMGEVKAKEKQCLSGGALFAPTLGKSSSETQ